MGKSNKTGKSKKGVEESRVVPSESNPAGHVAGTIVRPPNLEIPDGQRQSVRFAGNTGDGGESSTASRPPGFGANNGNENLDEIPSAQEQWNAMKAMMAQMAALTKALVPEPVVQVTEKEAEVVEVNPPPKTPRRKSDYLNLLSHVSKLGTKHFGGGVDPIVADEWRSRLKRNFNSTRCPEDYRKDIAVHFLEGDAHNWWLAVEKRMGDEIRTFADFELEFNKKFFPQEAWDRLECAYLDLVQGSKTVRQYDEEFNRLRRYVGRELEDEQAQVRRFIRGLRVEIRNHCLASNFNSASELVERAAMIEDGLEEERRVKREKFQKQSKPADKKRKWEDGKSTEKRNVCETCGKQHSGLCWKAVAGCGRCGSKDHLTQNCPKGNQLQSKVVGGEPRTCFYCDKPGHFRKDCPKLEAERQSGQRVNRGENALPPPPKRMAIAPRVYELSEESASAGNFRAITGTFLKPLSSIFCICIASCMKGSGT